MGIVATSQITIVDLNDQVSLSGFLTSSLGKVQFLSTSGTYTPSWSATPALIKAELYKIGVAGGNIITDSNVKGVKWYTKLGTATTWTEVTASNSNYELVAESGKNTGLKIKANVMNKNNTGLSIKCEVSYQESWMPEAHVHKSEIDYSLSVQGATGDAGADGKDAYTVVSSNESQSLTCTSAGVVVDGQTIVTKIIAYKGGSRVNVTVPAITKTDGITYTISGSGTQEATITGTPDSGSNLGGKDSGTVNIAVTVDGKPFTKVLSWSKSKQGANGGAGAAALSLDITGQQVFSYNAAGSVTPANIVLTATGQNFTVSGTNVKWQYWSGTAWTDLTTAATVTITPSSAGWTNDALRIKAYYTSKTSVFDEITLYKVRDGKEPVTGYIHAPSGTVIRNGDKTGVQLQGNLFWGSTDKSTDAGTQYKWEKQSASGAWTVIKDFTAGTNGRTITVSADDIPNMLNIKCTMKYLGQTCADHIVVTDYSDPIQATIITTNGDKFINSQGSTHAVARLLRDGVELDIVSIYKTVPATTGMVNGTIIYVEADDKYRELVSNAWVVLEEPPSKANGKSKFTYTWTRYNELGQPDESPYGTGKIIKITPNNITKKAEFTVQIED